MEAKDRRRLEMGSNALEFSRTHPNDSPGYSAALAWLADRLERSRTLAARQRDGLLEVRAATARKAELRHTMREGHLTHLIEVAKVAAREVPELAQKFQLKPGATTYLAFRTAAGGIAAEAQARKEVLVKHGLVESVLDELAEGLKQFDAALERGSAGRHTHVGRARSCTMSRSRWSRR